MGDQCVMGGQSAIADHVMVCSHVRIAARGGVTTNITSPGDYAGFPAQPAANWRKEVATVRAVSAERKKLSRIVWPDKTPIAGTTITYEQLPERGCHEAGGRGSEVSSEVV